MSWYFRGCKSHGGQVLCLKWCATNKVHMRVPAREPPPKAPKPQSCLAEPTDLVQLPATSALPALFSLHTPLKLVLQFSEQSASFYGYRTVISDLQKARREDIGDGTHSPTLTGKPPISPRVLHFPTSRFRYLGSWIDTRSRHLSLQSPCVA